LFVNIIVNIKGDIMEMTKEEFKKEFKRITRQLNQRVEKVNRRIRLDSYYQNKRKEFIALIDEVNKSEWFTMPEKGTRIHAMYHDVEWH
jgi:ribosome maturation protein Sdo1